MALELMWTPKVAKDQAELIELCESVKKHNRLPKRVRNSQPKQLWFPGNNNLPRCESIKLMNNFLYRIQRYIDSFEYNFTSNKYNKIRKDLGMKSVVSTAREIIKNGLPIRCVEATFLVAYLTTGNFKSSVGTNTYRHIVLFVEFKGRFGSLGLSRKRDLMYKPLEYAKLSDLIAEFKRSYESNGHSLKLVAMDLLLSHSFFSLHPIEWRSLKVEIDNRQNKTTGVQSSADSNIDNQFSEEMLDKDNIEKIESFWENVEYIGRNVKRKQT